MRKKERDNFWIQSAKRPFNLLAWFTSKKKRCSSRWKANCDEDRDYFHINFRCTRIKGHSGDHASYWVGGHEGKSNKNVISGAIRLEWQTYADHFALKKTIRKKSHGR